MFLGILQNTNGQLTLGIMCRWRLSPGDSARDLFGMVSSRDPFRLLVTSNDRGLKGHELNHLEENV